MKNGVLDAIFANTTVLLPIPVKKIWHRHSRASLSSLAFTLREMKRSHMRCPADIAVILFA